jgi:hypothetical protein
VIRLGSPPGIYHSLRHPAGVAKEPVGIDLLARACMKADN